MCETTETSILFCHFFCYLILDLGTWCRNLSDKYFVLRIDWPKGYKPLDEPLCGYRGEKCKGSQGRTEIAAGVLGGLLVFALIVTLSVYRKWKIEQASRTAPRINILAFRISIVALS
jgi:hypothetical protein